MSIAKNIAKMSSKSKLHFSLLDPDKQNPEIAGSIAKTVEKVGSSAIMVGGSTLLSQKQVDETVKEIKKKSSLPVILFPSGAQFISKYADAIFFMSLLNSRNLGYVIREHVKGAPYIKDTGIEPISMGYVIVEPGMTAGKVGEVDLIKKGDIETAVNDMKALRAEQEQIGMQDTAKSLNAEILLRFELENLIDLALQTAVAASNREESRGAHSREDFPERSDEQWLKHTLTYLKGADVQIGYKDVDISRWEPKPRQY